MGTLRLPTPWTTESGSSQRRWVPFLAGAVTAGAAWALAQALLPRRRDFDPRLLSVRPDVDGVPPAVVIPGILGSGLVRPDGTPVWLNFRHAVGYHSLTLPLSVPLADSRDDLLPRGLLGTEARVPRWFGFTEYYDLLDLLRAGGFRARDAADGQGRLQHIFTYDWRRDLVESARRLHETLEELAGGDPDAKFNLIGHSMGGLIARYYLRYGTAEPSEDARVTWAGARRIQNLILVGVPNGGGIHSLEALLLGARLGLSHASLAASVIARMPSVYQLLPAPGVQALLDHRGEPLPDSVHSIETWERFGWGPFAPAAVRRQDPTESEGQRDAREAFLRAVLERAAAFHRALCRTPATPCPVRVVMLGGDCLPTLARAVVPSRRGLAPRFEPTTRAEAETMFEAGDGRVTRASALGSHQPGADQSENGCGIHEVSQVFFGSADHHGIYGEPTFQSILLRLLLKPRRRARAAAAVPA